MTNSKKIAGLVGPTIMVLALAEAMNFHIWALNIAPVTFLDGSLLFVAGLSIIQVHNHWRSWAVLITLTGWFCILGGLYRMFVPEAPQAPQNITTNLGLGIFFAVGTFLTYKAYGRKEIHTGTSKTRYTIVTCLLLLSVFQVLLLTIHLHVPRTVQFDSSLPSVEINNYKYHMEIYGAKDSTPLIVVHGGPGLDYEYLKPLQRLSNDYQVIFYDQRGTGLSPRVDKKFLTIEQNLDDLHSIVEHFSKGKKVKLIGHSWGATLVVGYLSMYPEMVSQAVIVEPFILYPGAPVKEWVEKTKGMMSNMASTWQIAKSMSYYPFVLKEDGQEGYEYIGTKLAGKNLPGPPYNCEGQDLPPGIFKRMGYAVYNAIIKPIMDDPSSLHYDFTNGITAYHGDLMLMSGECSILGPLYQEKYAIPKLPPQTVLIKAANMGHHMITLNTDWTLQTIRKFLNHNCNDRNSNHNLDHM
jgi:proline iminopeptidase